MTRALWASDEWRSEVTDWLDARLTALGRSRTGSLEQSRVRPWGTVLHASTDAGRVWLKAPMPALLFELPLLRLLDGLEPRGGPRVLATDDTRGLVLMADSGESLHRTVPDDAERAALFAGIWPAVADVQIATVPHVPALLDAGVADHRPEALPARFDETLDAARRDHTDPSDVVLLDRIAAVRERYVDVCAELGRSQVPAAVDHNDLHDGNLVVAADGSLALVDWGDAVIAHPFATLLVARNVLASLLGDVGTADPRITAATDAYLARFAGLAPGEDLGRTARLAVAVAEVTRAWVWQRALAAVDPANPDPELPADFARGALDHLGRVVEELAALP